MLDYFKNLFLATKKDLGDVALYQYVAKHLARVALYELKGIDALHWDLKPKCEMFLQACAKQGYNLRVTETFRTAALQNTYYAKGRTSPGSAITNAKGLESYHQYGLAFDVAFQGTDPYPKQSEKWKAIGAIGESMGLKWGGHFNDNPHFEYHPNFSWQQLITYFKV